MTIKVTYQNYVLKEYNSFDELEDNYSVIKINCANNNLTELPANMNFPNLQHFYCHHNRLISLPEKREIIEMPRLSDEDIAEIDKIDKPPNLSHLKNLVSKLEKNKNNNRLSSYHAYFSPPQFRQLNLTDS